MNKTRHVTFRMTEQEYQDIMAIKGDMPMSKYTRECLLPEQDIYLSPEERLKMQEEVNRITSIRLELFKEYARLRRILFPA